MALYHYSPKDVSVTIAGVYQVTGYVDDVFINLTKDVKPFENTRSMDGEIARLYRKDSGYMLQLSLAQSSPTNDFLSAIYNIDVATQIGKFPLFIKDGRGSTTFMSLTTWIEDIPEVSFSNGMEARVWTFKCTQASLHIGGNTDMSDFAETALFGASLLPLLKDFGLL